MIEVLRALEESLADELVLEGELLEAGIQMRDALVALDLRQVEQATSREQNVLVALGPAGERRLRWTSAAARLLGLVDQEASVTRVAQRAGEPYASRLLSQADRVRTTLREVARVNQTNRALTLQSLGHVKRFFLILGGVREQLTYTRRGQGSRPEIPKVMIDRVI
jgi:hypothetical protein